MGNKCLQSLDKEGNRFDDSSDFHDADGILLGVRFIEDVIALPSNSAVR